MPTWAYRQGTETQAQSPAAPPHLAGMALMRLCTLPTPSCVLQPAGITRV